MLTLLLKNQILEFKILCPLESYVHRNRNIFPSKSKYIFTTELHMLQMNWDMLTKK
jgi:hypothetical protein